MQTYLVGGAVRDQLLGILVKEKDWVVVGASPEQMLALGYKQVGRDFPVFLNPQTHEEYALARTEKKVGRGYTGFVVHAAADVTLEQDLQRRDLTINAIAQTEDGEIIDPYNGQADLKNKLLRHISPAFMEDPVRILRVARFMAKFANIGFCIAQETMQLMQTMISNGEIDALVAERVWQEWHKALQEDQPQQFFIVLQQCHALAVLFPELTKHWQQLQQAGNYINKTNDIEVRFALLLHNLSKQELQQLCQRYRVPSAFQQLAALVINYYNGYIQALTLKPEQLLSLLKHVDALRRNQRFQQWLNACHQIALLNNIPQVNAIDNRLQQAVEILKCVNTKQIVEKGYSGTELINAITQAQINALQKLKT